MQHAPSHIPHPTLPLLASSQGPTYTLLHRLGILETNADPPRPAQMPRRLTRQVLHHDAGQHGELRLDV
jgi:hypothetical protein